MAPTPIEEYKKRYFKAMITVIIITAICLVFFFWVRQDLVRCHLKPYHKETGWEDSIEVSDEVATEIDVVLGNAAPTPVSANTPTPKPTPSPEITWNGLTRVTREGTYYKKEVFIPSLLTRLVVGGFILTVAATMAVIGVGLYFIIRSMQSDDRKALAVSVAALTLALALGVFGCMKFWQALRTESYVEPDSSYTEICMHAPIIYLYDDQCREATVKLDIDGELTSTYPNYGDGWTLRTSPDGTLTDANGRQYEFLFWEANVHMDPDTSRGFCVKGSDTAAFLEKALSDLGLSDKEANTFIMYWLPQMECNPYNVISFQTEAYENAAKMKVTPVPDTIVRVNMFFYASEEYVEIEEQDLSSMNPSLDKRKGFILVEWGGEAKG